jgi:hypothetical protein
VCDNSCNQNQICTGIGTETCLCGTGWTGDNCTEDIDECTMFPIACGAGGDNCTNIPGNFECQCLPTYGIFGEVESNLFPPEGTNMEIFNFNAVFGVIGYIVLI